ncbi:hypothetical protein A2853_03620 [Candidatus Kaiserbacteria bacterium RIFCSPHIGHO2_01_FULL_55_17]|uniref:General secretion pathway GspH domain-containing protein n=1 Tax=Candidatus Kaiserbacteria bacterium RIFCSPHIGHO2_01_FULL_55_17 TaxID=1798484 RepID=A0A1F6D7R6_9BACT|nr:MAG: hypothetical protein A2853_03620 [Candidatus Kaiserbacteria bacterium RIFCSPHIGHO2_01_FULL_55_17]
MELMVVTAIIVVISGVVLVNNNRFGGVFLLENLAYDIALSIRQAQVYGISVHRFGATNFRVGYGLHFSKNDPITYVFFADANPSGGNGLYEENQNETIESSTIGRGYYIDKLCAPAGADAATCTSVDRLDIIFKRPEPDAFISANGVSGIVTPAALQESARVVLKSPRGDEKSVIVEISGQIAIQ